MGQIKITEDDIKVGEPLEWNIFSNDGHLLFNKGAIISSSTQVQTLVMRGAFRDEKTISSSEASQIKLAQNLRSLSPFDTIHNIFQRLRKLFNSITDDPVAVETQSKALANTIFQLYRKDQEPLLGAVRLMHEYEYHLCHPVHAAILSCALGALLKYDPPRMQRLICATLTQNISMNKLQVTLQHQKEKPSEEQMKEIYAHPEKSVEMLKKAGVKDEKWLEIIRQHHEHVNGKGYPDGLEGDDILEEARIVALVDRYAALISKRAYRMPMDTEHLIQCLGAARGKESDARMTMLLIGSLGVYPPGCFVTLANDEIAVVTRRTQNPKRPEVASYVDPEGKNYSKPIIRNLLSMEMNIKSHTVPAPEQPLDLNIAWGFKE